jgi:asparagine synthase (glutamine-hydrolysing)
MCGLLGIISPNASDSISTMLSRMAHRGPDDFGFYHSELIALGHHRLSIQDLSKNGHQPMFSEDNRYVIVFNGEIYNHWDIRKLLSNKYHFKSSSDTETLLYGYIEFGVDLFNMLNGIFSFCIYDSITKEFVVVRDQFGVKPLYYELSDKLFSFASELKSLIDDNSNRNLSPEALYNYLYFLWSPGEKTPFLNIYNQY